MQFLKMLDLVASLVFQLDLTSVQQLLHLDTLILQEGCFTSEQLPECLISEHGQSLNGAD